MQLRQSPKREHGLTLIELMIGIVVGILVVSGAIAVYVSTVRGSSETLRSARLNQELRAVSDIMSAELRRAGYRFSAVDAPVETPLPSVRIHSSGSCIRYAYDADDSGNFGGEVFGFRLKNGEIQMRRSGDDLDECNDDVTWQSMTDSESVVIDSLLFTAVGSLCVNTSRTPTLDWSVESSQPDEAGCNPGVTDYDADAGETLLETNQINIAISASHANDTLSASQDTAVRIRNDRLIVVVAP